MAQALPPLRRELDIMPSPIPEQPGVLIRDPFRYTEAMIVVPPVLAPGLMLFDGRQTELDLQTQLTRATGELSMGEAARHLVETLRQCGFLESEEFHEMREVKHREFANAQERLPAHAGPAYPPEAEPLREKLREYGAHPDFGERTGDSLIAVAAPHVSPEGGYKTYAAAYRSLHGQYADRTFVVLGTSHYGEPEKFGLTRKPYVTPFGRLETDQLLVDELVKRAPDSIVMEDYCHRMEHSIEFQCVFLQHVLGKSDIKILPILCGPMAQSLMTGKAPESHHGVRCFLDALGEIAELHRERLLWVLGIDLAHIGPRYGDSFSAKAGEGRMQEIQQRDEARLERVCAGDAEGFFELVHPNYDDLRWCGYSPVYTFLSAVKGVEGKILEYEQWNIDDHSVVSFVGAEFRATDR